MTEEEPKICQICSDFEPQAWRKSLCRNCFHTLDEHSEDMLAAQAEAAAKEKAEKDGAKKESKDEAKTKSSKQITPGKAGASDSKETKSLTPNASPKTTPSSKSSSTSSSSSPSTPKSSLKSSSSSPTTTNKSSSSTSPSLSTKTSSSPSSSSSSPSAISKTGKSSSATTTATTSASQVPATISKAKTLTSKFENVSKTKDSDKSPTTKPLLKPDRSTKSLTGSKETPEDAKRPFSKSPTSLKDSKKDQNEKDSVGKTANGKDEETKLKPTEDKDNTKVPLQNSRHKHAVPFGKSMLRSTKDKDKDAVEKRADKILAQKEASSSEVKSKLASLGGKSKFDSLERPEKLDDKKLKPSSSDTSSGNTSSTTSSAVSSTSGSGNNSNVKIGHLEKTASVGAGTGTSSTLTQRVGEKEVSGTQHGSTGAKYTGETDKPGPGRINNGEVEQKQDARKPGFQVGGERGGKGGVGGGEGGGKEKEGLSDSREEHSSKWSRENRDINTNVSNKRVPSNVTGGIEPASSGGKIEKDRATLHHGEGNKNVKDTRDAKQAGPSVDGISRPGFSAGTSASISKSKTASLTPGSVGGGGGSGSSSSLKSSSTTTSTTSSLSSPTKTTTASTANYTTSSSASSSQNISKYLPSLQSRRTSKDVVDGGDVSPKGKSTPSSKDTAAAASPSPDTRSKELEKLSKELKSKTDKVVSLESQLTTMEKKLKSVEEEKKKMEATAAKASATPRSEKDEMEKTLQALRSQLSEMQAQSVKMASDNKSLSTKLQDQEKLVKECQDLRGKTDENQLLERDLELTEKELDEVKDENSELQREIMEMKNEMDEMYDTFRENEQDEFRELQKELDLTAKNCRILQFKLRKAERRNEQIEEDRMHYEEKLRHLQDQFDSQDAKNHIRVLEEELRIAKEVSVRLHDELDIVEDKKLKALEDNKHLTELLEHTDKRQFRMEMEIDKLRELVCDLRQQLKETKTGSSTGSNNRDSSTPEKTAASPGRLERQSSKDAQEYDASQLMRDLCDTMERENDLKDQLKFTEEEAKTLRRRVSDMDEENESLRVQLQRMSEKASKHKKKEQERAKELEEERKVSEAAKAYLTAQQSQDGHTSAEVTLVLGMGPMDDVIPVDEPIPVCERKDSTDEDLMNVMQLRIQLEMLEQELMNAHKKMDEMDLENENLTEEVKFLQERLGDYEKNQDSNFRPDASTPTNEYYLDKIKDLNHENDILRWKLIEKDREAERMSLVQSSQSRHSKDHHQTKRSDKLKKSKSLDNDNDPVVNDLRKQLDHTQTELIKARQRADEAEEKCEDLLQAQKDTTQADSTTAPPPSTTVPGIVADDAAVENIELRDKVGKMEQEIKAKADLIKTLTCDLQKLSLGRGAVHNVATSPINPSTTGILSIPHPCSGTASARAKTTATNQTPAFSPRDPKLPSPFLPTASVSVTQTVREEEGGEGEEEGREVEDKGTNEQHGNIVDKRKGEKDEQARKKKVIVSDQAPVIFNEPRGEADGASVSSFHVHFAGDSAIALETGGLSGDGGSGANTGSTDGSSKERAEEVVVVEEEEEEEENKRLEVNLCAVSGEFTDGSRQTEKEEEERKEEIGRGRERERERKGGIERGAKPSREVSDSPVKLIVESSASESCCYSDSLKEQGRRGGSSSDGRNDAARTTYDSILTLDKNTKDHKDEDVSEKIRILDEGKSRSSYRLRFDTGVKSEDDKSYGDCDEVNSIKVVEESRDLNISKLSDVSESTCDRVVSDPVSSPYQSADSGREEDLIFSSSCGKLSSAQPEIGSEIDMASVGDGDKEKKQMSDDTKKKSSDDGSGSSGGSESKSLPKSEEYKSVMARYPGGKSNVVTTGEESRVELMEKVLDMDDEISDLLRLIRKREDDYNRMCREVKYLRGQMEELRDETRRNELDLLQELDMLHDKNAVMSNLLDIINERAEAAEEELEKRIQEGHTTSPPRSASNVSQVSALSDTSMGSDEVFLNAHGTREGVVNRDWEAKLKGRIESLERLLAEERQKVTMAEKKLAMAATETVAPSVTDDVKLRLREKELLQAELIESQRHLHIAADQIQGLKERFQILDEEHNRLKEDYGKLYDEVEKPLDRTPGDVDDKAGSGGDAAKTPVNALDDEDPFVSKRVSVIEAPNFKDLKQGAESAEIADLKAQLAEYKKKTQDLEYKIEEINDIWRSKSSASDRDRDELEIQLNDKNREMSQIAQNLTALEKEIRTKDAIISECKNNLEDKCKDLDRKRAQWEEMEEDLATLREAKNCIEIQVSQKDGMLRAYDDKIRTRDERLKEKDDILLKLRSSFDEAKTHVKSYEKKIRELTVEVNDKEAMIALLKDQILSSKENSQSERGNEVTCPLGSEEGELTILKAEIQTLKEDLDKKEKDKLELKNNLEESRKTLSDSLVLWNSEKSELQRDMNILEEKVRLYEVYNTQSEGEAVESLKEEAYSYFTQREALNCQLASSKIDAEATERTHRVQIARLQTDLNDKLKQLKSEVENNTKLKLEAERLSVQAEKAYRFQQEVRMLKAEHQAMKVRYESRLDKMGNECNRMVTAIEKLKRQHEVDEELIHKFEQNLTLVTERYTDQLLKADDDQNTMTRQMNEIEELRTHLEEVMNIVRELREKSLDQDRLSKALVNRMSTEKSRWEVERVGLISQVNQLEEQLSSSTQQSSRARDIQVNLGISWEKERKEQKRLLAEAHTLALDLQDQLRSRDEAFAHDKKEILRQMEGDRMAWMRDKRDLEKRLAELESADRKLGTIQARLKEAQQALQEKSDLWKTEQKELSHQLTQSRQAHSRDCKKIEEVLAGLVKFKELGSVIASQSGEQEEDLGKSIITSTLVDAVQEVTQAAEDLSKHQKSSNQEVNASSVSKATTTATTTTTTASQSHSNSHAQQTSMTVSNINKSQTNPQTTVSTVSTKSSATVKTNTIKTSSKISEKIKTLSGKLSVDRDPADSDSTHNQDTSSLNRKQFKSKASPSLVIPSPHAASSPVTLRPTDQTATRRYDRPPSYTSGTRSAQSSRSTTPEVDVKLDPGTLFPQQHHLHHHYNNQPFYTLPKHAPSRHHTHQPQTTTAVGAMPATRTTSTPQSSQLPASQRPKRPATFIKSLSMEDNRFQDAAMNSPLRLYSPSSSSSHRNSNSASSTPTHQAPYSSLTTHHSPSSLSSLPSALENSNLLSPDAANASPSSASTSSQQHKKFSPRTARKKFFEEATSPSPEPSDNVLSWPHAKRPTAAAPKQLPDANEFRKEAEVEHDLISPRHQTFQLTQPQQDPSASLKMSNSWDENMYFQGHPSPFDENESTSSGIDCATPETSMVLSANHGASSNLTPTPFSPIPENQLATTSTSGKTSTLPRSSGKSAKEKRKLFFKKSESLESPVGSSIAKAGVSAMPMAAPSGFTPSNFFAAVKGKLKPMLRHKSQESKVKSQEGNRPPSPLFIPTEVPDINFGTGGTTILPVPVPQRTFHDQINTDERGKASEASQGRSRQNQRKDQDKNRGMGRSKSMDERGRVVDSNEVWRFNETDL